MHEQLDEAAKRLDAAKDAYGHAVQAIDRQYLKPLVAVGDPAVLKGITALRATYADVAEAVADVAGTAVAHTQPAGFIPATTTKTKKAGK